MKTGWKIAGVVAALIVVPALTVGTDFGRALLMRFAYRMAGLTSTRTTLPGAYFRYTTVIKVDGKEDLVFDNVVACNTRITRSEANGTSVLPGMTPNLFVRRTKDNHAVLITTPELCTWAQTNTPEKNYTRRGFLPPAVVWFDDADDLTFGIAYAMPAAYESAKSRLKVVSTYVGPATREEFEAWYDGPRKENLAKQEWINPPPGTTAARYNARRAYLKKARASRGRAFPMACYGAQRFELKAGVRSYIRKYWPKDRPRYWTPTPKEWTKLFDEQFTGKPYFIGKGGRTAGSQQFWHGVGPIVKYGPTLDGRSGEWPAEVYPAATSGNAPFLTEDSTNKDYYLQKIFYEGGANEGFAWCYTAWGAPSRSYDDPLRRHHYAQIDGYRVRSTDGFKSAIQYVFEDDRYMFHFLTIGIHPNGGIE